MATPDSLALDPSIRSSFGAAPGWQPENLRTRTRSALTGQPSRVSAALALPSGPAPGVAGYDQTSGAPVGSTGGIVPGAPWAPVAPPAGLPPPSGLDPDELARRRALLPPAGPPPIDRRPGSGGTITMPDGRMLVMQAGFGARGLDQVPDAATAELLLRDSRRDAGLPPSGIAPPLPAPPPAPRNLGLDAYAAGLPLDEAKFLAEMSAPPPVDRAGTFFRAPDGSQMYWQNNNQVAALPDPKTQPQYFDLPKVTTVDGVRFYQTGPGEAPRPLREQEAGGGSQLNPFVLGSNQARITTLEQELADHQAKQLAGDNRYGFANALSRDTRVAELNAELSGLRATLSAGRGTQPAAAAQPAPSAAAPQPPAPAASAPAGGKLYQIEGGQVQFRQGSDLLKAAQQAVDDGVIDAASARALLARNGYKPKAKQSAAN